MLVKDLILQLQSMPEDREVFFEDEAYDCGLNNTQVVRGVRLAVEHDMDGNIAITWVQIYR